MPDPVEAICFRLDRLCVAFERVAGAYEKMAKLAESKKSSPPAAAQTHSGDGIKSGTRKKADPKDILTITGCVLHFGVATDASGNRVLTKPKKKEYWVLKMANGWKANIFSASQATICSRAYDEQAVLIVDYTKTEDGKYNNIEEVKIAASGASQPAAASGGQSSPAGLCTACGEDPCTCAF